MNTFPPLCNQCERACLQHTALGNNYVNCIKSCIPKVTSHNDDESASLVVIWELLWWGRCTYRYLNLPSLGFVYSSFTFWPKNQEIQLIGWREVTHPANKKDHRATVWGNETWILEYTIRLGSEMFTSSEAERTRKKINSQLALCKIRQIIIQYAIAASICVPVTKYTPVYTIYYTYGGVIKNVRHINGSETWSTCQIKMYLFPKSVKRIKLYPCCKTVFRCNWSDNKFK